MSPTKDWINCPILVAPCMVHFVGPYIVQSSPAGGTIIKYCPKSVQKYVHISVHLGFSFLIQCTQNKILRKIETKFTIVHMAFSIFHEIMRSKYNSYENQSEKYNCVLWD